MRVGLYKRWKYPRITRFLWKFGIRFEPTEFMTVIWDEDSFNGREGGSRVTRAGLVVMGYWRVN